MLMQKKHNAYKLVGEKKVGKPKGFPCVQSLAEERVGCRKICCIFGLNGGK